MVLAGSRPLTAESYGAGGMRVVNCRRAGYEVWGRASCVEGNDKELVLDLKADGQPMKVSEEGHDMVRGDFAAKQLMEVKRLR